MTNNPGYLRLQAAKKGLWNPYLLTPSVLKAWWCADDLSASSVTTWTDRIGGMATTATSTAIPTWSATGWTAGSITKAGVTFDGAANCMVSTTLTTLPTGAVAGEMWALADQETPGATAGTFVVCRYGGTAASTCRTIQRTQSGSPFNSLFSVYDLGASLPNNGIAFQGGHIIGGNWSGTVEGGRMDGLDFFPPPNTATISTLNTSATRLRIGANNATAAGTFFTGTIRHLFITTTLTALQRQQLEGWMAWDGWVDGKTNPLPLTHPYKNAAP